ncbi:venom acid phosphatase Acph-1-like isoform X3 [Camponotus floridanus]|uniref:venom acid phosphatase Acph-1-like isoform X3 n=1 Tax=Camponotus floridanus TaxID=104421 RepID=UPI000DC680E9|nr:venom acid phosphatase Acph-1-like isoform X3 [Camponotus floridanus]
MVSFCILDNYMSITLVISLNAIVSASIHPELKLINVVFRHGDRTPSNDGDESFPTDPYVNDSFFPTGVGQLTNHGKKREYDLGQALRARYKDFLGGLYLPKLVVAHSSDYDRTKMSLQLVLAALFSSTDHRQRWNTDLNWQPIPMTYISRIDDNFYTGFNCPKYLDEYDRILNLPEIKKGMSRFKDIMSKLTELTGPMIRAILNNMITGKNPIPSNTKLYLYSGHETNIAAILHAFKLYKPHVPEYSSAVILELLEQNKQNYVKFLYYRGIPSIFDELQIPGCEMLCPFDKFSYLIHDLIPSDEDIVCDKRQTPKYANMEYPITLESKTYNLIKKNIDLIKKKRNSNNA